MAKVTRAARTQGFSMVEMLVAVTFVLLLMAGLSAVFKGSLSTFYTAGEGLSASRRNVQSIDLLRDDLNMACMYISDLSLAPSTTAENPPFFILPNMAIVGAPADPQSNDPLSADELYFLVDQPLPFEGTLVAGTQKTMGESIPTNVAPGVSDTTFEIDCFNAAYAHLVKKGQKFIFKDAWEGRTIGDEPTVDGTKVTVTVGADPFAGITGSGSEGGPLKEKHMGGTSILFVQPAQMVRYRVQYLKMDPQNPAGVPCLVRDQGTYSGTGFVVDAAVPQQVITENVRGFKVLLSVNSGASWAGGPSEGDAGFSVHAQPDEGSAAPLSEGWDPGIRSALDTQLGTAGRPGFVDTRGSEHWFRDIPTLVRVDITTRSATRRAEYAATANTTDYKLVSQSLVFMPKHTGLTLN